MSRRAAHDPFWIARSSGCNSTSRFGIRDELDRVLGIEANFAGMSFLTVDKLRNLKIRV